jgi:hypothetical protein
MWLVLQVLASGFAAGAVANAGSRRGPARSAIGAVIWARA